MTTGCIVAGQTPVQRREQYAADITYGTNNEFGFDYLRDNMAWQSADMVQRGHHFAIVDEVDSILIDEARTPLIISGPPASGEANRWFTEFARLATRLVPDEDYEVDEKKRTVGVLEPGIAKVEDYLGIDNLYESANTPLISFLNNSIKANALFKRDKDYVVMNGEVLIVDEHTGRILVGRRYNEGIHQAIEAKEGVQVKAENQTLATVTLQNYFRLYDKLSGMTGTAETEAAEFMSTYKLGVVPIPTNKPMVRIDQPDLVYKSEESKFAQVVEDIVERHQKGQPVLVGTTSVEKSEYLSRLLAKKGVRHEVLNAKNHAREAAIVAQAGRHGAVTVATNMAGRGTDIMLGGNAEFIAVQKMHEKGGLSPVDTPEEYEPSGMPSSRRSKPRSTSRPRRSSRPAVSTCSAPSATSRAVSTTSCAAVRAARATPVRAGSTCRSPTTSCVSSTRARPRASCREASPPTMSRSSPRSSRGPSARRSRRSRPATPRSARTSSSTTTC